MKKLNYKKIARAIPYEYLDFLADDILPFARAAAYDPPKEKLYFELKGALLRARQLKKRSIDK